MMTRWQLNEAIKHGKDALGRRRTGEQANIHPDMLQRLIDIAQHYEVTL